MIDGAAASVGSVRQWKRYAPTCAAAVKKVEEEIIQVKIKSGQDALNYPIKLNDKIASLSGVIASADTRPTQQSHDVFNELSGSLDSLLAKYKKITETDLAAFNSLVKNMEIPAVIVKPKEPAR